MLDMRSCLVARSVPCYPYFALASFGWLQRGFFWASVYDGARPVCPVCPYRALRLVHVCSGGSVIALPVDRYVKHGGEFEDEGRLLRERLVRFTR